MGSVTAPHRPATHALGPFKIDSNGLLSPATPQSSPGFAVCWRHRQVRARMRARPVGSGSNGMLDLQARIGRVPSTADAPTMPSRRHHALGVLRLLPGLMPAGWRLTLLPDHTVMVQAEALLTLPVSAVALVTEMAMFLLGLTPYLELLDAEGIGATFGSENT